MAITKYCTKCNIEKSIENFALAGIRENRRGVCNQCRSEYMKEYRTRPHVRNNSISNVRKYRYGISEEDYKLMYDNQNGKCAICGKPETCLNIDGTVKNLSIDHDHRCCPGEKVSCGNCIRGLLCAGCNRGLGYFKDDENILFDAIAYLIGNKNILVGGDLLSL